MALIMNQNLYSLSSQYFLGMNQTALGKSIERLSSGLRINHAADDASGMAISEKMRGQISGLKRASMNAQDGISYLQTAEGAMEQASSILQRMRELAVQASNGIYTTNDRAEIQKEVDQLKQELDRVSTATEFNTRKLINGDGTALWSSDTELIGAIIRAPVNEGNYEINMAVRPGTNHILKSNIFSLKEGAIGANIVGANKTNVGQVTNPNSMPPTSNGKEYVVDIKNKNVNYETSAPNNSVSGVSGSFEGSVKVTTATGANTNASATVIGGAAVTATVDAATTDEGYYVVKYKKTGALNTLTKDDFSIEWVDARTGEARTLDKAEFNYDGTDTITSATAGKFSFKIGGATTSGDVSLIAVSPKSDAATGDKLATIEFDSKQHLKVNVAPGSTLNRYVLTVDGSKIKKESISIVFADNTDTGSVEYTGTVGDFKPKASVVGSYSNDGSAWAVTKIDLSAAPNTITKSGYLELEMLEPADNLNSAKYRVRFIDAKNGSKGEWQTISNTEADKLKIQYNYGGADMDFMMDATIGMGGKIQKGDKLLIAVSANSPSPADGGGAITITGGPNSLTDGPRIVYDEESSLTKVDNGDTIQDFNNVTVHYASLDSKTGNLNLGNITLGFKESPRSDSSDPDSLAITSEGSFKLSIKGSGEAATTTTKLRDIKEFVDGDGNNIFDIKQELTIYGNGKKAIVHLEGNDTIATLVKKLNKAIVVDLGMGSDDPQVNANLVRFITIPDEAGWGTVPGTIVMQTAMTGLQGELSFVGNQSVIDGFGFTNIQKPTNNETVVTIRDAHTGNLIGTETTGDDRVYTLLEGVEVVLDSRAGVKSSWDIVKNEINFYSNDEMADKKYFLHLVDNRSSLQIGPNKGQDLDVSIPQLDLKGLGLENVTMVSQTAARRAIGSIDQALTRVVSARATVGAQVSRLEHTIENLATARQNLSTAESRIRDLDVAEESTTFTRNQVLVQSGISMLAQANQLPQMALQLIQGR